MDDNPINTSCPAVSVIIPLYNAEKYFNDCLDSILAQTFQDFEVIVVDDCSTDNSFAIAESYVEKFDGRLILTRLQKNSGNAGYSARNKGFSFSRGEYVYFMDADDFIKKTALEELYTAAKNFDADVVYTGSRYRYTTENGNKWTTDTIGRELKKAGIKDKPTLIIDDPHKNFKGLSTRNGLYWTPWTKFVRRMFLLENEITFYETPSGGDHLWTLEIFACAKRFLRIPNAIYFWRDDSFESVTRNKKPINKQIYIWSVAFLSITKAMTDLTNKRAFLKENPSYCYAALNLHLDFFMKRNLEARRQVKAEQIYDILRREFEDKGNFDLTMPFFFSFIDSKRKELAKTKENLKKVTELAKKREARIAELKKELEGKEG